MEIVITLCYCLFTASVIYPPTELVTAGFTIPQLFEGLLGSENLNFVSYHMRRTSITMVIHSFLPIGYWFALFLGGWRSEWLLFTFTCCWMCVLLFVYKIICWWENKKQAHPVVKTLLPYVTEGSDWRVVAADLNAEFKNFDKVCIQLRSTSKFIATPSWLIKVSQYRMDVVRQAECTLVATATDCHNISVAGENEVQYLNIKAIPSRDGVKPFTFRITTAVLRDLQPRLFHPVRVPDHLSLLPTLIERFVSVFRECVMQNPEYIIPDNEEVEQCIGCMQEQADVKIERRCQPPPVHLIGGPPECQSCHCRVVWCVSCMARWWAARAGAEHAARWLSGRCTCPVCRAPFCLLDVRPARKALPAPAPAPAPTPAPAPAPALAP